MGKEKKSKKGGMVLIIGMGAKPKDMKKAERRVASRGSNDAQAATQAASRDKTHSRLKSNRLDINNILERRSINPENFHGEMHRRHGMDMDEYLSHDKAPFDIQPLIDELAEKSANERGQAKSSRADRRAESLRSGLTNPKIKGMLRSRGIDPKDWERAVRRMDNSELTDKTFENLLRELTPEMSDEERKKVSNDADRIFRQQGGYDSLFDEVDMAHSGEVDTDDDQRSVHDMPLSDSDPSGDSDEEEKLQRLLQLFEARGSRDPMDDAMRAMHAMGGQEENKGGDRDRKHSLFGEASTVNTLPYAGSGERVQDSKASGKGRNPAGPAPPGSVEAEYYGFRGASPIQGSGREEPEEEDMDMDAVEQNMFRTSFDNPNVMSAAWALLKANPDMLDAQGNTVHPSVMNYAQQARALQDSLEYQRDAWQGGHGDMRDDDNTSRFRGALKNPRFARHKVGGETMQGHHDFARNRSKRDTSEYMQNENDIAHEGGYYGPDPAIQRTPRPEDE
jgi:hypothetical protein